MSAATQPVGTIIPQVELRTVQISYPGKRPVTRQLSPAEIARVMGEPWVIVNVLSAGFAR